MREARYNSMTGSKGHMHSSVKGSGEQLRTEKRSVACITRLSLMAMSITEHHHRWSQMGDYIRVSKSVNFHLQVKSNTPSCCMQAAHSGSLHNAQACISVVCVWQVLSDHTSMTYLINSVFVSITSHSLYTH